MGIEFYLVKPKKREIFYLGKHFNGFEGIVNFNHVQEARFLDYEDWGDFFWDTLRENFEYFLNCDIDLDDIQEIIYKIYDWCISDEVYLDNDCSENFNNWKNFKETASIVDILTDYHNKKR